MASKLDDLVRALRVAEPELGIKAIARRLSVTHPSVDARAVRDALAEPAQPSQRAQPAAVASSSMDEVTPRATQAPLEPTVAEEGPPTRFRRVKLAWPGAMMGEDRMGLDKYMPSWEDAKPAPLAYLRPKRGYGVCDYSRLTR